MGSDAAERASLAAMAARVLSGAIEPRYLTRWAHARYGHDGLDLAEDLACLDDVLDEACEPNGTLGDRAAATVDKVRAEARRIVELHENTPGPTGPGVSSS